MTNSNDKLGKWMPETIDVLKAVILGVTAWLCLEVLSVRDSVTELRPMLSNAGENIQENREEIRELKQDIKDLRTDLKHFLDKHK